MFVHLIQNFSTEACIAPEKGTPNSQNTLNTHLNIQISVDKTPAKHPLRWKSRGPGSGPEVRLPEEEEQARSALRGGGRLSSLYGARSASAAAGTLMLRYKQQK